MDERKSLKDHKLFLLNELLLFGLLLLADKGGDELDYFVLLATRQGGDFFKQLLDFARRSGFRLVRFSSEKFIRRHAFSIILWLDFLSAN